MSEGAKRIAAERQRQIDVEGWDADHDDEHQDGALAQAGVCYALESAGFEVDPDCDAHNAACFTRAVNDVTCRRCQRSGLYLQYRLAASRESHITVKRLSSGYYHIRGQGPCNWSQPPSWPCDIGTLVEHAFPQASREFLEAAALAAGSGREGGA